MRYHITFYGQVQGVGFRYTVSHAAERYRLSGWVRNEYDGSVTCEIQGEADEIDAWYHFIDQARYIIIDRIEKHQIPEDPDERGFGVKF
ncbi:MAG: acylphosphatase [Lachnospiraceae bacterium]|nr:acylphosphatase [Lachnospiraceae bacterium]